MIDELRKVGKVGIGVAIRASAHVPDVSSAQALKRELLQADVIVFNRSSTGLYVEKMLKSLGGVGAVAPRSVRVDDGAAVMLRLLAGAAPHEIGFAAMTGIMLFEKQGVRLVRPLPPEVQKATTYVAATLRRAESDADADAAKADAVAALLHHLRSANAKADFVRAGVAAAN
ncbi:MAG: substrate-binding domain-containing protein [Caldimonas sp.]